MLCGRVFDPPISLHQSRSRLELYVFLDIFPFPALCICASHADEINQSNQPLALT